jgi:hypothetical protein
MIVADQVSDGEFDQDTQADPQGVAGQVAPHEVEAEDQTAQCRPADRVDPGSVVQLADLDRHRDRQRQGGDLLRGRPGQDQADAEAGSGRPEGVPGVGGHDAGEVGPEAA